VTAIPAKPDVVGSRPYTGNSDGPSAYKRIGMNEWIRQAIHASNESLWNNGSWSPGRDMKGKPGTPSVHNSGRAVDLSFLKTKEHPTANRAEALKFIETVVKNANTLGVEAVLDYFPTKYGRGYRCDRQKWQKYTKPTIHGAPGGSWFHVEISPQAADSVIFVKAAFLKVFGTILD
jgi:hypothetical protein